MRRTIDINARGQIWVPSRSIKRNGEQIAEIDGELLTRANILGVSYQAIEEKENPQQPEIAEENEAESEGESKVIRFSNCRLKSLHYLG